MGRQKLLDNIEWDKVGDFESSVHTAIVDLDTLKALVNEFKPLVDEREGFYHGKYDSNKELGYDFKHIEMLQYYYCGCMHDCCGHKTQTRIIVMQVFNMFAVRMETLRNY